MKCFIFLSFCGPSFLEICILTDLPGFNHAGWTNAGEMMGVWAAQWLEGWISIGGDPDSQIWDHVGCSQFRDLTQLVLHELHSNFHPSLHTCHRLDCFMLNKSLSLQLAV